MMHNVMQTCWVVHMKQKFEDWLLYHTTFVSLNGFLVFLAMLVAEIGFVAFLVYAIVLSL